jgi:osmoprotectant transport system ATP-binding protein
LKKTIVFVTHDIEEAAKLGDRIAVLSRGGVLEQYDTPTEVLGRPATTFVADFVGADRGVRRLAVTVIEPDDLFQPPRVDPGISMLDARATAAGADSQWAVVVDGEDHLHGWIELSTGTGTGTGAVGAGAGAGAGAGVGAGAGAVGDHLVPFDVQLPLGTSLRAALGEMLQHDVRWIPVMDADRYLGVITPNRLHAAMRRSVGGHAIEG